MTRKELLTRKELSVKVPENTSRQALLERGWYVVQDVETAFLGLSGKAHDLLIIIKHFQGENPDAFPKQERLAEILKCSVRTVQRILKELADKGALSLRRTGRASQHRVNYVLGTVTEIRVLLGGDLQIPDELILADTTHAVASDASDSDRTPYIKNHLPRTTTNPLPTGGGDADAPQPETGLEDDMGINRKRPAGAVHDEFDPVTALGLWESQESPEAASDGLDGLFPAQEVTQASTSPRRRIRSQAQADAAGSLAFEFDQLVRQQPWAGPAPVNKAALARNLSQWKRDGLTADQIRAMMQRYVAPDHRRTKGKTPWLDFIGQRHKLLAAEAKTLEAQAVEEHRHDADASYWLGSMAGGQ